MPIEVRQVLGGIDASVFVNNEIPTPAPDGATTVFTVANPYEAGSFRLNRDQSSLLGGATYDFTETTDTTFTVASAPDADEVLWVSYIKK